MSPTTQPIPPSDEKPFSERFEAAVKASNLRHRIIAQAVGVSLDTIKAWRKGYFKPHPERQIEVFDLLQKAVENTNLAKQAELFALPPETSFAGVFRTARLRAGLSQASAASMLSVHTRTVEYWEQAHSTPSEEEQKRTLAILSALPPKSHQPIRDRSHAIKGFSISFDDASDTVVISVSGTRTFSRAHIMRAAQSFCERIFDR